jgi:hypothetical protein
MHNISNLFYFGTTLYMFRTVSPSIIRILRLHIFLMLYVQSHTPDDGWRDCPKHVECLGFVSPCIIIYSSKSANQMHQSLRCIACHLNTALHVSGILMPITGSLSPAVVASGLPVVIRDIVLYTYVYFR